MTPQPPAEIWGQCPNCGGEVAKDAALCPNCGCEFAYGCGIIPAGLHTWNKPFLNIGEKMRMNDEETPID